MNILFLDQFTKIGGGQRSLLELLPAIRKRNWRARVALPGAGAFAGQVEARGFEVDFIRCGPYTPGRKRLADFFQFGREIRPLTREISALVAKHRIDLLYVNGPRLLPAAAGAARDGSIPLIYHCHHRLLQAAAVRLAGEALRWSRAAMIGCCRFAAQPLEGYVAKDRQLVIYNGVAGPSWSWRPRSPSSAWNIGVIGRVEPEKGQLEFVAAARILSAGLGNCRFVIAGAPLFSGPEYLERVRKASAGLPIEFLGWQEDVGRVFSQLDLLVVPSTPIDSTPRVVLEAFAGRLPVVAFPSGGIPEIMEDDRTGFLASTLSPVALAARIEAVMSMGPLSLREVAEEAQAAWRENHTLERFQEAVTHVIAHAGSRISARNITADSAATVAHTKSTGG